MFDQIDAAYFRQRAEEERRRAADAVDMAVAETHKKLAEEYEAKAAQLSLEHVPDS